MTTAYYNTAIDHTTDAGFRAWVLEFSNALTSCGLALTADTGQINTTTVVRPGATNTSAGYQIRRLTCSGAPDQYIKFEYGSGGTTNLPNIWFTIGKGSDGAGNIIALNFPRDQLSQNSAAFPTFSTTSLYPTFICVKDGVFWFMFKASRWTDVNNRSPANMFYMQNSVDDNGVFDGKSMFIMNGDTNQSNQKFTIIDIVNNMPIISILEPLTSYCSFVGSQTTSGSTSLQAYRWYYQAKIVRPVLGLLGLYKSECALLDTFTVKVVGPANHTFIVLENYFHGGGIAGVKTNTTLAAIWE